MVAQSNKRGYDTYQRQNIMTASAGELTLMLYDGALKFLRSARLSIESKDIEKAHEYFTRAEAVVEELMQSLDMNYDISKQLFPLYEFINLTIIEANISKNAEKADIAIELLGEIRDTWNQAIKINRQKQFAEGAY